MPNLKVPLLTPASLISLSISASDTSLLPIIFTLHIKQESKEIIKPNTKIPMSNPVRFFIKSKIYGAPLSPVTVTV